jgi:hypothetical protein
LLSAYGVDGTSTANDIFQRWYYIFNQSLQRNITIIGFSTGKETGLSFTDSNIAID